MATAGEIGQWLMDKVREVAPRRAYQNRLVREMRAEFGSEWSYTNQNGNPAIDRGVLKEFGKLKDEYVVWDQSDQSWRIVDDNQLAIIRERKSRQAERRAETARRKAEREN